MKQKELAEVLALRKQANNVSMAEESQQTAMWLGNQK